MPLTHKFFDNLATSIFDISESSAEVGFTLKKGSDYQNVGRNNLGVTTRFEQQVIAQYSMTMPDLCPDDYNYVKNFETSVSGNVVTFFIDDFSDNFVFPWEDETAKVRQYGLLIPIAGTTNYRMVKVYQAGNNFGIKPIYRFDNTADVKVNDVATGFTLNRTTGIFSSVTATGRIQATTDHYYTPVRFVEPIKYTHKYQRGWGVNLGVTDPAQTAFDGKPQRYRAEFQMIEQKSNEVLNLPLNWSDVDRIPADVNIALDILKDVKDSSFTDDYRTKVYNERGFQIISDLPTRGTPSRQYTITSDTVKHEKLIYWGTIFRATAGGAFDIL
jgi:hypothetical protein